MALWVSVASGFGGLGSKAFRIDPIPQNAPVGTCDQQSISVVLTRNPKP